MPFGPTTLRNTREEFVLQKIEYYKVNEYMGKSNWKRHYFDTYKEAVKMFKKLKEEKRKIFLINICMKLQRIKYSFWILSSLC